MKGKRTIILMLLVMPALLLAQSSWREAGQSLYDRGEGGLAASQGTLPIVKKSAVAPLLIGKTWNAYGSQSPYTNLIAYDPFSNLAAMIKRTDRTGASSGRIAYHTSTDGGATWSAQIGPINAQDFPNGRHPNVLISNPTKSIDPAQATVVGNYNDLTTSGGTTFGDVIYASTRQTTPGTPVFFGRDADDAFSYSGAVDVNNGNCYFAIISANSRYFAISKLTNGGTTLSSPHTVIAPGTDFIQESGAAVDVGIDGTVHWVGRARWLSGAPNSAIYYWRYQRSTDGGTTWSTPEYVGANLVPGRHLTNYEFDMIVDANNQVHIASLLVDTTATSGSGVALYDLVRSAAETWSAVKVADIRRAVYTAIPQEPGGQLFLQLNEPEHAKTQDGENLAIKWIDIIPNATNRADSLTPDVWLSTSTVASGAWSTPRNISNTRTVAEVFTNLATYIGNNGQLFMFYLTPSVGDLSECNLWFLPELRVGVSEKPKTIPQNFVLEQNYPNPFNPSTNISFSLPMTSTVKLQVLDVLGHEVAMLINGRLEAGVHQITFVSQELSSGVYFYRLQAGAQVIMKKMVLLR